MELSDDRTRTSAFGVGRREGHDASAFYARFSPPVLSDDEEVNRPDELLTELGRGRLFEGSSTNMSELPANSVALVVTSPPYFVGKEYELAVTGELDSEHRVPDTYIEFLDMLRSVFAECVRVLEPGGRIAVNVANLGRKPYRSLSADVISILQDDLGLLLRGEVIWEKSAASSGSCAWGSFAKASNPVLRDMTERVIIASKGRFSRAISLKDRRRRELPSESTLANDEFVDVTRDVWRIDSESATRIGHPAPFPVELPRRLIDLYTYRDDIVLDPFVGSGTTVVAAARTGRIGVGYDTDPDYIALAERRVAAEHERMGKIEAINQRLEQGSFDLQLEIDEVAQLSHEDRQEHFQARAVREGKKAQDIAHARLREAEFEVIEEKPKHSSGIVEFNFRVTSPSGAMQWWVDVSGAFTTSRPGLQRIDTVWKLLGRVHVLQSMEADGQEDVENRVLVLTSNLPKAGSPGDRALRSVGPRVIFDAIELLDPAGFDRLRQYAQAATPRPLAGFWSAEDLVDS